jgi:ketosteroid isomerase-like protein
MRMSVARRSATLILGVATVVGPGLTLRAQDPARAAIEAANKKFVAAFAKGDAAGVAAAYSADANAFPPNAPINNGRAAIHNMWQDFINRAIASVWPATTEVESAGNIAYESGTYEMKTKDGKVADRGKYCVVWKKANGQWMLHRDIWSTDLPAGKS